MIASQRSVSLHLGESMIDESAMMFSFFARRVWLLEPRYRPIVVLSVSAVGSSAGDESAERISKCTFSLTELGTFNTL